MNEKKALKLLLQYASAAKKAAAVRGHQGIEPDDHYWMGAAWAYQDIERLLEGKLRSSE